MADSTPNPPEAGSSVAPSAAISSVNPAASELARPTPEPTPEPRIEPRIEPAHRPIPGMIDMHSHIDEFAANVAGGLSPFGDDVEFPLPIERLGYQHPGPANRPALAGD